MSFESGPWQEPGLEKKPEKKLETPPEKEGEEIVRPPQEAMPTPEPVMTAEELVEEAERDKIRTDKIERRRALVDDFLSLEAVRAELKEAHGIFHGQDFRDFSHLSTILNRLRDYYQDFSLQLKENLSRLPREVFVEIIGQDYLEQTERRLLAIGEQYGLYLPYDELGGGDYMELEAGADGSLKAMLFDFSGHGASALWSKLLITRFIELRRADQTAEPADLSVDVDDYIAGFNFLDIAPFAEFVSITARKAGQEINLEIEAGGGRVIVREPSGKVVVHQVAIYPPLGVGMVKATEQKFEILNVPAGSAVYLASDGLFDIVADGSKEDPDINTETIDKFFEDNIGLTQEKFHSELVRLVKGLRLENRLTDDVTFLAIPNLA